MAFPMFSTSMSTLTLGSVIFIIFVSRRSLSGHQRLTFAVVKNHLVEERCADHRRSSGARTAGPRWAAKCLRKPPFQMAPMKETYDLEQI